MANIQYAVTSEKENKLLVLGTLYVDLWNGFNATFAYVLCTLCSPLPLHY